MTKQREVILEELERAMDHPTADEVYELVRKRLPRISLGTVYRNLEVLARGGKVQKIKHCGTQMRFDAHPGDHIHVRCLICGRIEDIKRMTGSDPWDRQDVEKTGFRFVSASVELTGICPACAEEG